MLTGLHSCFFSVACTVPHKCWMFMSAFVECCLCSAARWLTRAIMWRCRRARWDSSSPVMPKKSRGEEFIETSVCCVPHIYGKYNTSAHVSVSIRALFYCKACHDDITDPKRIKKCGCKRCKSFYVCLYRSGQRDLTCIIGILPLFLTQQQCERQSRYMESQGSSLNMIYYFVLNVSIVSFEENSSTSFEYIASFFISCSIFSK